jgi:hypothetical protein
LKQDPQSRLGQLLADARRFVLSNQHMIEEAPLQAYVSALVFAPTKSMIRQALSYELPRWLTRLSMTRDD